MSFVQPKTILDNVLTRIPDNSAAMRAKCLIWLNEAMRAVIYEPREWEFSKKTVAGTITTNQITTPADFGRVLSITVDTTFLTPDEELTAEEAFDIDQAGGDNPVGYTIDSGVITLHPAAADGPATLAYVAGMPTDYIDDAIDTIFPIEFSNLFTRAVVSVSYELEVDERTPTSLQLTAVELSKLKRLDNKRKATAKLTPAGYVKGRV